MHCSSCGTQLLEGKRFCHVCGAAATASCTSCGAPLQDSFAFCPDCGRATSSEGSAADSVPAQSARAGARAGVAPTNGAPLEREASPPASALPQAIAGERKQVTVLFCDLAGSVAIAEKLDPEDYRDLLDRYLELAIREIDRLGGVVNQLAGDGFMALFGAPISLEEEPERAVASGLAIQRALDTLNRDRAAREEPELRARIGIHTGPVVVGTVGNDLKMDYTAIGDTTNLAARLQALAEPGSILISSTTANLVHAQFRLREIPAVEVKGKSEPVIAHEVLGETDAVTPMAIAEARGLTPLVGFREELAQLEACADRIQGGLPQLVSVIGGPGAGKSRIVHEFKRGLAARDLVLFEGRGSSLTQAIPFAPLRNMMKQFFGVKSGEDPDCACEKIGSVVREWDSELTEIYPTMCQLLTVPSEELSLEGLRQRTMDAFGSLLEGIVGRSPIVMILEDLHWFDEASLESLERQISTMDRFPIMVLVTHRPDYRANWQVRTAFTQLSLRPFELDEAVEIVRARAGGELPRELEELIVQRSEGNPFFIEEITRALQDEGQIVQEAGTVRMERPVESIQIPNTVQELIEARLDRLTPAAKRVAQVAAVFGRQFRRDHLEVLVGADVEVARSLEELEHEGFVHPVEPEANEYRFGESLTQSVSYEGLLMKERRELHERIATLVETDPRGMSSERAGLVAHHLARSENREKAIESLLAAAQDAEELPSYPSATELYRQSMELAEQAHAELPSEQTQRWILAGATGASRIAVLYSVPDRDDEEAIVLRGVEMAQSLGDDAQVARMTSLHGMVVSRGDGTRFTEGVALMEEALQRAEKAKDSVALVSARRALAFSYMRDGEFEKSGALMAAVRSELESRGEHDPPSDIYMSILYFASQLALLRGDLDEALERASTTYERCLEVSNRTLESATASVQAQSHFERGAYAEAQMWAERALAVGSEIGNVGASRTGAIVSIGARRALGERVHPARMLDLLDQSMSQASDMGSNANFVVEVLLDLGEIERASRFADAAALRAGGRQSQVESLLATAHVLRARGPAHCAEARDEYALASAVAREIGSRGFEISADIGLGSLAMQYGERAEGEQLLARAAEAAESIGLLRLRDRARLLQAETPPGGADAPRIH